MAGLHHLDHTPTEAPATDPEVGPTPQTRRSASTGATSEPLSAARAYAWDFFQLHSSQRIATFNFFVTVATAIGAVAAAALQASASLLLVSVILGFLLSLMAFVFWKLDQRNAMLIKQAESALIELEDRWREDCPGLPESVLLFASDKAAVRRRRARSSIWPWRSYYSFSDSFQVVFLCFGLIGAVSSVVGIVLILRTL